MLLCQKRSLRWPARLAALTMLALLAFVNGCLRLKEPDPSQSSLAYQPQTLA